MRVVGTWIHHTVTACFATTMTSHADGESHKTGSSPPDSESATDGESPLVFEFRVPVSAFGLAQTLPNYPEIVVEIEQLIPTRRDPMPYLWVTDGDTGFEDAAAADPSIDRISRMASLTDGALYRVEWEIGDGLLRQFVDGEVSVLQAEGNDDEWIVKVRFESRDQLDAFRTFCDDRGIDFEVIRLYDMTEPKMGQYNVSEKQREALVTALRMGHFEIPRDATLEDVASELGISQRAASERLRRGETNLVSNTLTIGQPTGVGIDED